MIIASERYKHCATCGKPLEVIDKGISQDGFDRLTGEQLFVHAYVLKCKDYAEGYSDRFWSVHDSFIYLEPVENP